MKLIFQLKYLNKYNFKNILNLTEFNVSDKIKYSTIKPLLILNLI